LRRDAAELVLTLSGWNAGRVSSPATRVRGADAAALFRAYAAALPGLLGTTRPPPPLPEAALPALGQALLDLDAGKPAAAVATLAPLDRATPGTALIVAGLVQAQDGAHATSLDATRAAALKQFADDASPTGRELEARLLLGDE